MSQSYLTHMKTFEYKKNKLYFPLFTYEYKFNTKYCANCNC